MDIYSLTNIKAHGPSLVNGLGCFHLCIDRHNKGDNIKFYNNIKIEGGML